MRRHVLAGHFGRSDTVALPQADDEVLTRLRLIAPAGHLDHGIGRALASLHARGLYPSNTGFDLLVLAAHVHAADTRISRTSESQDRWTREIRIVVPVANPQRWRAVAPLLAVMLNFLTGDRWRLDFRTRPSEITRLIVLEATGRQPVVYSGVSLLSGGLDSLIGLIDELESGADPLFVSHAGDSATSDAQKRLVAALNSAYRPRRVERIRLPMTFPVGLVRGVDSENSTRGRSFLFFALGAIAGTGLGRPFTLRAPENGLIALNVPLDPLRLGALTTRTTHPFYIARWNELLEELDIPGRIENPYWDRTKGEMVADCANPDLLRRLAPRSLSCAAPTKGRWQGHGIEHCGYCFPCLIRRGALASFGDTTTYSIRSLSGLDAQTAEGRQIRSVLVAHLRLQQRPSLARILIHKPGPLNDVANHCDALADVYRRGLSEVATAIAGAE